MPDASIADRSNGEMDNGRQEFAYGGDNMEMDGDPASNEQSCLHVLNKEAASLPIERETDDRYDPSSIAHLKRQRNDDNITNKSNKSNKSNSQE
jgi:hypothetical protein